MTASAVCIGLLLLMPFVRLDGERLVLKLGPLQQPLPGACWFQTATGLDCPFCGLSRGFVCAAHFRWAEAWRYNWVSIPALALVVFYAAAGLLVLLDRRRQRAGRWWAPRAVVYARAGAAAVLLVGWLARILSQVP